MKWFKHYENAHTNRLIQALLMEKNGHELHSMYWLFMELLCGEFKKDTTKFTLSIDQINSALHVKYARKSERFLQVLVEFAESFDKDLLKLNRISKKFYEIETPIILELMGKDFKRARQCRRSDAAKNKEIRIKNKNIKQTKNLTDNGTSGVITFDFEALYKNYPRKEGKKQGLERCKRQITTQDKYNQLLKAISNYSALNVDNDKKYIKQFSSFMNSWEDYVEIETGNDAMNEFHKINMELKKQNEGKNIFAGVIDDV